MNPRHLLVLLAFGLPGGAYGQEAQPATVYKLRNVAAADVVKTLAADAGLKKLNTTMVAEPVTNSLFVSGDAASQKRVTELLAGLDKQLPSVHAVSVVFEAPAEFAKDIGLGEGDKWVLTPREAAMFSVAMRREKQDGKVDVLSRPHLHLTDNQTGFFEVFNGLESFVIRATPRISPKGDSILLRVESEFTKAHAVPVTLGDPSSKPVPLIAHDTQSSQVTEGVPTGNTLLVRAVLRKSQNKELRGLFLVMTPTVVSAAK